MQKHCLIVGYGPGLSHAIAETFLAKGYEVTGVSRAADRRHLDTYAHAKLTRVYADASNETELIAAIEEAGMARGHISVLIYNAAAAYPGPLTEITAERLRGSLDVNVTGALVAANAVLPHMLRRSVGTLLFTGGGLALHPAPGLGALSVGKAAIRNLALVLASELAGTGVHAATVTISGFIEPGGMFDPQKIARVYWDLHMEAPGNFQSEVVYNG